MFTSSREKFLKKLLKLNDLLKKSILWLDKEKKKKKGKE